MGLATSVQTHNELFAFFRRLLTGDVVDGLLMLKKNGSRDYSWALVTDPEELAETNPFVPFIPVNAGRIAKNLTFTEPEARIAIVCRPCEVKALIELTKFEQVHRDNLYIISIDCIGTYEHVDFHHLQKEDPEFAQTFLEKTCSGEQSPFPDVSFRKACRLCSSITTEPSIVDMQIGYIGIERDSFLLSCEKDSALFRIVHGEGDQKRQEQQTPEQASHSETTEDRADLIQEVSAQREKVIEKIRNDRQKFREKELERFGTTVDSLEKISDFLSPCIRCYNCMDVCPICYCKECVFRSPTFSHSSDMIIGWAQRKGAQRMLENTLMFHLTRLNHMATSCIQCGLCSSGCPMDIDVASLFIKTADKVQSLFDYDAGRRYDDSPPVITFREDELEDELK
jgi:formate dehydrogenase subunit beta